MIYVMSDLHGCYEEYLKMLEKINFQDTDTLYIVGDICDRGPNPMKILFYMMEHENIIPIFGNHDIDAYLSLIMIYDNRLDENDRRYMWWLTQGGKTTMEEFKCLSRKKQEQILSYLEDFRHYEELDVNGKNYLLVHGGLKNFSLEKPISSYRLFDLVWERPDYDTVYFPDKIIVSGHTPTKFIDINMKGKIVKKNNHIAIDCGCVFGYGLGCICLDTLEEFYV